MFRIVRNISVFFRRWLLRLLLLVPQPVRSFLSRNPLLTRFYEFFDRAKYEPILDEEAWQLHRQARAGGRLNHVPLSDYEYEAPALTGDIRRELESDGLPLISVIMPVYNTRSAWLKRAVDSVREQWYPNWELCIVDDHSSRAETRAFLQSLKEDRIKVRLLDENVNIAAASNSALALCSGDYVALMDHDDELTVDALYEVWRTIDAEGADFVYSDEDKLDEQGRFCDPHFKADFAPDMFLSQNYPSHLGVIRKSVVDRVGGFSPGTDGAQDYDLYLKVLEETDRVVHIPKVLYHWRKVPGSTAAFFSEKSYAQDAGQVALEAAVERRGLQARVEAGRFPGTYRMKYRLEHEPLISIVIPFRDKPDLLGLCVRTILGKSTYRNFEIVGVNNESADAATFSEMEALAALDSRIRFADYNQPFNFSGINNFAVRDLARGEQIVLLNNDIEILTPDWLEALLEFSQRPDIGAVGARLLYPNGDVQHAGVILGIGGVAGHSHKHLPGDHHGYFSRPHIIQNVSAVTAACMMVKREVYLGLDGMDAHHLKVAFNDVDFCLRARERGLLNLYTPYCEAIHHESRSRGVEDTPEKQERFRDEVLYMMKRHADALAAGDPYYNPNLSHEYEDFSLAPTGQIG